MSYSLRFTKRSDLVAANPSMGDVYIVEYPKSGVTWLMTLIANLALISSKMDNFRVTFSNVRMIIPDIHSGREIGSPPYRFPPFRFMKSHSVFNQKYTYSIYLVRHPVDVASSFYRYLTLRGHISMDFSKFIRDPKIGIRTWGEHVESWLCGKPTGGYLHLVRYEDLIQDANSQLAAICENYGWVVAPEDIALAVERSSVENMKITEERFVSHDPRYSAGFVKSGSLKISEQDRAYIHKICASQIKLLGYDK